MRNSKRPLYSALIEDIGSLEVFSKYHAQESECVKRTLLMGVLLELISSWHARENKEFQDLRRLLLDSPIVIDAMMDALEPNRRE